VPTNAAKNDGRPIPMPTPRLILLDKDKPPPAWVAPVAAVVIVGVGVKREFDCAKELVIAAEAVRGSVDN